MNDKLKFHQEVKTPDGVGVVQGWLVKKDEPENGKIIVSFSRARHPEMTTIKGIWQLKAYPPEQVSAL